MIEAVTWTADGMRLIDQRQLPHREDYLHIDTVDGLVDAVSTLAVRGAPALGAAGGLGVVVALRQAAREGWDQEHLRGQISRIRDARPTAVNLAWGVDRVTAAAFGGTGHAGSARHTRATTTEPPTPDPQPAAAPPVALDPEVALAEALAIIEEDRAANRALSRHGADWILQHTGQPGRVRVLTHCNTGALATTGWGTAYGIIHQLHDQDRLGLVYADETRPLLQGARLTSWELTHDGIDHVVQADGAAASTILRGLVDVAVVGADRIAANGDTANKVGSLAVALACRRAGIPFVVAAPASTVDLATPSGQAITIEDRDEEEILAWGGVRTAPQQARGFNPAFDVTPNDLIAAIVTEHGAAPAGPGWFSFAGPTF